MKNILITGVSSGIGYVTALYFLERGYRVFGSVRKEQDLSALHEAYPDQFTGLVFDTTDENGIKKAYSKVEEALQGKGLDILVNNAGISVNGPMAYVAVEEFRHQLDVNVLGVLRVTQTFLPLLGFDNELPKGHIINISSGSGRVTRPFMGPYSASKFALESMSDAFRRELLDMGIKVTVVEPGPIKTDIWTKAKNEADDNKYAATVYGKVYKNLEKMVGQMEAIALDTEKVAALIYDIAEGKKNKTRYLIAPKRWMFLAAIYLLPDRTLDKLFKKQFERLVEGDN
ncbi:SDR family oxidoreductase [Robertkochia marina]|uniref:SDR family oxidoreductase n=1 Tax=Robertkochia marina TaxID=1227945 RepID=A0A4S3M1A8_9FLAO|nr:SDR family oxidoreductase [Robertkochia marina]THD67817.1 SDR family oxidoreductase [Robertkochia marina]TRZ41752.1 SDR family oxidoreductase [Robertkochia marina]